jgi:hypothetical protein
LFPLREVILSPSALVGTFGFAVRNLDDDAFEIVESLGFSPFGYDAVAPDGAHIDALLMSS